MDTLDWKALYKGNCPKCTAKLKERGEFVQCAGDCGFKMNASKYFSKYAHRTDYKKLRKKTDAYFAVKGRSRSEVDNMMDICQMQ